MTVDADPSAATKVPASSGAARLWGAPLLAHVVVLGIVLLGGLLLVGPRVGYSSDEGVTVLQARLIVEHGTWLYQYPLSSVDPNDEARPFVRGDRGTKGLALYAKHPAYPAILAAADRVADPLGVWLVTIGGTLGAAAMAALLARRLDPGLARPTLWVVGIGSPLFFDSYFITAHSLAAFAVGAAALTLLHGLDPGPSVARRLTAIGGAALLVAAGAMLRTEGLFVALFLAVAVVGLTIAGRIGRRVGAVAAVAMVGGGALGWLSDRVASRWIIGTPLPGLVDVAPSSWLAGRWQSVHTTWLQASYSGERIGGLALSLAALLLVAAALALRFRRPHRDVAAALGAAAVACWVARYVLGTPGVIPGLALAFPIGVAGAWSLGRRSLAGTTAALLTVTSALVAVAVLATQYPRGGGIEWGGRYFALLIPLAAPVLVQAAAAAVRHRPPDRLARWAPALAVALCVLPALVAVQALRAAHDATARTLDAMQSAAADAGVAPGQERPIVLSRNRLLPQIAYTDFDRYDWVVPDRLEGYGERLAEIGVDRLVLVSPDPAQDLDALPGWRVVGEPATDLPIGVVVIEHDPST